jgi:hypothetical protein
MAGPWEKFQKPEAAPVAAPVADGPWNKFQAPVDVPKKESGPGGFMSTVRGYGQGGTVGFGDEIGGAEGAVLGALHSLATGENNFGDQGRLAGIANIAENYSRARNAERDQNKAAEKAHPYLYNGGDLAGTVALASGLSLLPGVAALTAPGESVAGRVFTKEGAKIIGKEALNQGIQNAILGGARGAGSSENNALSEAGKGAALGGALGAISGGLVKPIADTGIAAAGKVVQGIQNIPDRVVRYLEQNPQNLDLIQSLAKNKDAAIKDYSERIATDLSKKVGDYVSRENQTIDGIIKRAGPTPVDPSSILSTFDDQIAAAGRGISDESETAVKALTRMKDRFAKQVEDGTVNANQVNFLRKEINKISEAAYDSKLGENPILAKSASEVGDAIRDTLDAVHPEIREANMRLKDLIEARQAVSKGFGAKSLEGRSMDFEPADIQKVLTSFNREAKLNHQDAVERLSNLVGSDLHPSADLISNMKSINFDNANLVSRLKTGFANNAPLAAAMLGSGGAYLSGGDAKDAGILGALGMAAGLGLNSRMGTKILLENPAIQRGTAGILESLFKNVGTKVAGDRAEKNTATKK